MTEQEIRGQAAREVFGAFIGAVAETNHFRCRFVNACGRAKAERGTPRLACGDLFAPAALIIDEAQRLRCGRNKFEAKTASAGGLRTFDTAKSAELAVLEAGRGKAGDR